MTGVSCAGRGMGWKVVVDGEEREKEVVMGVIRAVGASVISVDGEVWPLEWV